MSLYIKQVEMLVALQDIDSHMFELNDEMAKAPAEVNDLKNKCGTLSKEKDVVTEKLGCLYDQEGRLSIEIEDDGAKIRKSKNKLMQVGNSREYHAMMREVDSLDKLNKMREEEKQALSEELLRQQSEYDRLKNQEEELSAQIAEKMSTLDVRVERIKEKLAKLSVKRNKAQQEIPAPILGRYEFIRSRLSGQVVVPVTQGICGGCHISIPPQSFIELQKGTQILSCPNCQRIIYWAEHLSQDKIPSSSTEVAEDVEKKALKENKGAPHSEAQPAAE